MLHALADWRCCCSHREWVRGRHVLAGGQGADPLEAEAEGDRCSRRNVRSRRWRRFALPTGPRCRGGRWPGWRGCCRCGGRRGRGRRGRRAASRGRGRAHRHLPAPATQAGAHPPRSPSPSRALTEAPGPRPQPDVEAFIFSLVKQSAKRAIHAKLHQKARAHPPPTHEHPRPDTKTFSCADAAAGGSAAQEAATPQRRAGGSGSGRHVGQAAAGCAAPLPAPARQGGLCRLHRSVRALGAVHGRVLASARRAVRSPTTQLCLRAVCFGHAPDEAGMGVGKPRCRRRRTLST